jgi:hypothetical protein
LSIDDGQSAIHRSANRKLDLPASRDEQPPPPLMTMTNPAAFVKR